MNKKSKIVKTYGAVHKRRLPVILAVMAVLAVAGVIIGMNIYDEYHTYAAARRQNLRRRRRSRTDFY
ncbi:hypothetical protein DXA14_28600 [Hungatella hathewayi]|nr:hypothetical protein DXA14_28600 [Hungatella hathewayi]